MLLLYYHFFITHLCTSFVFSLLFILLFKKYYSLKKISTRGKKFFLKNSKQTI